MAEAQETNVYVWSDDELDDDEKTLSNNTQSTSDDELENWDPRVSAQLLSADQSGGIDMAQVFTGAPLREGQYCKFPPEAGSNHCWKGTRCTLPHRGQQGSKTTNPDEDEIDVLNDGSTKVLSMLYDGLPWQINCPDGAYFMAKVVHVVDPYEFYMIPHEPLQCLCKREKVAMGGRSGFRSYIEVLREMKDEVKPTTGTHYFPMSEVIAYLVSNENWQRAVVTQETKYIETPIVSPTNSLPLVGITLLDTGEKITTTPSRLSNLPARFFNIAPHAYKCMLHGVIPVCDVWCSKAKDHFKSMVDQKNVLVEVKRSVFPDHEGRSGVFLGQPYKVSVRVKSSNGNGNGYMCVEQELAKTFRALPVNPFVRDVTYAIRMIEDFEKMQKQPSNPTKGNDVVEFGR